MIEISRRTALFGGATVALTAALPLKNANATELILTDEAALQILDNAVWIPQGPDSERIAYVIAAPWCPHCKALFNNLEKAKLDIQFRWIMTGARDPYTYLQCQTAAYTRDPQTLNHFYKTPTAPGGLPDQAKWLADWNRGVEMAVGPLVTQKTGQPAGYPQVIWPTANGLMVNFGFHDLEPKKSEFSALVARPEAKDISPRALSFPATVISDRQLPNIIACPTGPLQLRCVPDIGAPVVTVANPSSCYYAIRTAQTAGGQNWAAFQYAKDGNFPLIGWSPIDVLKAQNGKPFTV